MNLKPRTRPIEFAEGVQLAKTLKRIVMSFGLDNERALVFAGYLTRDGMSFGPLISGGDIHLTMFTKDGYFDVHLTVREHGRVQYIPIVHEPVSMFWRDVVEDLRNRGFNKPYDPEDEAYLFTDEGMSVLEGLLGRAGSTSIGRGTAYIDLNLLPFIEEFTTRLPSGEMLRLGRAKELLDLPEPFRVGMTPEMLPLKVDAKGVLVTYPVERNIWMPKIEKTFGMKALYDCLESRGLAESFIKPRRDQRTARPTSY